MGAIVDSCQPVPLEALIQLDATARATQFVDCAKTKKEAANRVNDEGDEDAGAGAFGQGLHELPARRVRSEDVAFQIDRSLCVSNGGEHRWIELRGIRQDLKPVVPVERRLTRRVKRAKKFL